MPLLTQREDGGASGKREWVLGALESNVTLMREGEMHSLQQDTRESLHLCVCVCVCVCCVV